MNGMTGHILFIDDLLANGAADAGTWLQERSAIVRIQS